MRTFLFPILVALILASCSTTRRIGTETHATVTDTLRVTVTDTLHLTVTDTLRVQTSDLRDSTATATTRQRDSITTRETITIRFDRETGQPLEQVISRLTLQVSDTETMQQLIVRQQHIIDSLSTRLVALMSGHDASITAAHQSDTIGSTTVIERGDAARTPLQTFCHKLRNVSLCVLVLALIALAIYLYRNRR